MHYERCFKGSHLNYFDERKIEFQRSMAVISYGELIGNLHTERFDSDGKADDCMLENFGINPEYALDNLYLEEKEAMKKRFVGYCEQIAINQSCILRYSELSDTGIFESLVDRTTFKTGWGKARIDCTTELLLKSAVSRTEMIAERLVKEEVNPIAVSELSVRMFYNLGSASFAFAPNRESLANLPLREYVRYILKGQISAVYKDITLVRGDRFSDVLFDCIMGSNIMAVIR